LEQAMKNDDMSVNSNLLDLYPDPAHFIELIAKFGRTDIASELFVRLLKEYSTHKSTENEDPTRYALSTTHALELIVERSLLYVQLIVQMQTQLAEDKKSSINILDKPGHLVSFIVHVLRTATGQDKPPKSRSSAAPTGIDKLRFVPLDEHNDDDLAEFDDENLQADDEMVETAVNLLLSILESETFTLRICTS
jgi:hypothetical protein